MVYGEPIVFSYLASLPVSGLGGWGDPPPPAPFYFDSLPDQGIQSKHVLESFQEVNTIIAR